MNIQHYVHHVRFWGSLTLYFLCNSRSFLGRSLPFASMACYITSVYGDVMFTQGNEEWWNFHDLEWYHGLGSSPKRLKI